jgi:hypothetical protein
MNPAAPGPAQSQACIAAAALPVLDSPGMTRPEIDPIAAEAKLGARRSLIAGTFLVILLLVTGAGLWIWRQAERAPTSPVQNPISEPPARPVQTITGNPFQDRLMRLPSTEQARVLAEQVGGGCTGTLAFLMGLGTHDADRGDAYWSVQCADGKRRAVVLSPGKTGGVAVLDCDAVKAAGMECFHRTVPPPAR